MQFVRFPSCSPAATEPVLPTIVQLTIFPPSAPPPPAFAVEFQMIAQFLNAPHHVPPPPKYAVLETMMQFMTKQFVVELHHTPPPEDKLAFPAVVVVAPPVSVNPFKVASFVNHAQRTAEGPLVAPAPLMIVTKGPLMLCTIIALFRATRLVKLPYITLPPDA